MIIKYRVHEVAKDLNVPSREIIELLARYYEEPRKHMTALSEEELNLIFEYYTRKTEVGSLDAYFEQAREKRQKAEEAAKAEEEAKKAAEQAARQAALEEAKQAAQAGEKPAKAAAKAQPAQRQPQKASEQSRQQKRPGGQQQGQNKGQPDPHNAQAKPQTPKPAAPQAPKQAAPRVHAADRTVRHVDTRGSQVELDKYNERYEQIAPEHIARESYMAGKQKIKQRSQHDRRAGASRKETEAEKLKRLALEKARKAPLKVTIPDEISVGELASRLKVTASAAVKKLVSLGVMASVSQNIDYDTAALLAMEFGAKVEKEVVVTIEDRLIDTSEDNDENLEPRSPVVVVMGHVDHGKTSLLDAIRHSHVAEGEFGGITQHIGAYRVSVGGKEITFLDTPGHEAFTAMRARGAQATDIAVLVVAADDGIMPQTVEAINHAKAADVAIIVAINKIDKPGANPDRVKQQLTEYGLVPEEWGGDTVCVNVSALKRQNIDKLLEMILLVAEMKNLRANPHRAAKGVVIEARLDKGRGPIATVLVQNGTLHSGDLIIAGTTMGRIRAMNDENGERLEEAGPSVPVEITGLSEVPAAGDIFHAVKDERMARELVEQRRKQEREKQLDAYQKVTLDNLFERMQQGEAKELNIIVKADTQGSAEAVSQSLVKLSSDEVRVQVIHSGVGAINESDVYLAETAGAVIVGFNVRPDPAAAEDADAKGIELRMYRVIYDCLEDVKAAMKGMLAPKYREVMYGRAEVRVVYKISNVGTVAGCYVLDGKLVRNSKIRVVRDGIVLAEDKISSLKRFKDDAREVAQGFECGVGLEKFSDIRQGDIFESFNLEEYRE